MVVAAAAVIVAVRYEDLCRDCWPTLLLGWESSLCRTLAADLCWNRSLVCPSGEGVAPKTRSWLWSAIDLGHIMVWKGASRLHQTTLDYAFLSGRAAASAWHWKSTPGACALLMLLWSLFLLLHLLAVASVLVACCCYCFGCICCCGCRGSFSCIGCTC